MSASEMWEEPAKPPAAKPPTFEEVVQTIPYGWRCEVSLARLAGGIYLAKIYPVSLARLPVVGLGATAADALAEAVKLCKAADTTLSDAFTKPEPKPPTLEDVLKTMPKGYVFELDEIPTPAPGARYQATIRSSSTPRALAKLFSKAAETPATALARAIEAWKADQERAKPSSAAESPKPERGVFKLWDRKTGRTYRVKELRAGTHMRWNGETWALYVPQALGHAEDIVSAADLFFELE